ncbi:MAG: hypothetical protein GY809_03725 [Planctomycetes bacterium]|nr:hypothetical protein [Planctomycetota bacterium]
MTRKIFMVKKWSYRQFIASVILAACLLSQITLAQDQTWGTVHAFIQIPKTLKLKDQIYHDINQDGIKDLILSVGHSEKQYTRSLRIHYQQGRDAGFKMAPDETIPLTPDVIAYACADIASDPGCEILLFTANACFGYRLQKEGRDALFKVVDHEFLWQLPDQDHVFSWQRAILDFNGDGRVDLFLPQADGLKILLQTEAGFVSSPLLEIPEEHRLNDAQVRVEKIESSLRVSFGSNGSGGLFGEKGDSQPLVNVHHSTHVPLFTDFNGDSLYDIVAQTQNRLQVWQQGTSKAFHKEPTLSLKLPKDEQGNPDLDIAANQYVVDLNQDNRCDFILCTKDRTSKKLFTQILIYINHKDSDHKDTLFDEQGIPQQLIKIAGLPSKAQLKDINGDGFPDLSFVTLRPDLLDQVKTLASKSIELQFLAYFNHKGRFSKRPDLTQAMYVHIGGQGGSDEEQGRFLLDLDKDGLLDLLVRDTRKHIAIRLLRRTRNGIQISKAHAWDMTIPENARIVYEHTNTKKPVLLIVGSDQIMYVRFK